MKFEMTRGMGGKFGYTIYGEEGEQHKLENFMEMLDKVIQKRIDYATELNKLKPKRPKRGRPKKA